MNPSLLKSKNSGQFTTAALRLKYFEVFGEESRSANRGFLFRRIAYGLQARTEGDAE